MPQVRGLVSPDVAKLDESHLERFEYGGLAKKRHGGSMEVSYHLSCYHQGIKRDRRGDALGARWTCLSTSMVRPKLTKETNWVESFKDMAARNGALGSLGAQKMGIHSELVLEGTSLAAGQLGENGLGSA